MIIRTWSVHTEKRNQAPDQPRSDVFFEASLLDNIFSFYEVMCEKCRRAGGGLTPADICSKLTL